MYEIGKNRAENFVALVCIAALCVIIMVLSFLLLIR